VLLRKVEEQQNAKILLFHGFEKNALKQEFAIQPNFIVKWGQNGTFQFVG